MHLQLLLLSTNISHYGDKMAVKKHILQVTLAAQRLVKMALCKLSLGRSSTWQWQEFVPLLHLRISTIPYLDTNECRFMTLRNQVYRHPAFSRLVHMKFKLKYFNHPLPRCSFSENLVRWFAHRLSSVFPLTLLSLLFSPVSWFRIHCASPRRPLTCRRVRGVRTLEAVGRKTRVKSWRGLANSDLASNDIW